MIIKTRDFGEIDINEDKFINFPNGIYAFEDEHKFVLVSPCGEGQFPMFLQAVENVNLCFVVFDPKEFVPDYSVEISDEDKNTLLEKNDDKLDYLVISVVPEDYMNATANMKSPIVVNSHEKIGVQVIATEDYPIKFSIFKKEEI